MDTEIVKIRRKKLSLWFSVRSIPEKEKSYISQLINGKASFGEKAARRLEETYKIGERYLDTDAATEMGQKPDVITILDESKLTVKQLEMMQKIAHMGDEDLAIAEDVFKIVEKKCTTRKKSEDG